jgi:phage-related protein/flagellar biosynthesis chaperone FliJ
MNVGVLKVSLQLDTAEFKKALSSIEAQLKTVAAQGVPKFNTKGFADVNAAANEMKKALGAALPISDQLTKRLGEQEKQQSILAQALQKTIAKHGEGSLAAQKQELALQKLQNNIDQTKAALKNLDTTASSTAKSLDSIGTGANDVSMQLRTINGIVPNLTTAMMGLAAISFAGMGIALANITGFANEQIKSVNLLQAQLGLTAQEAEELGKVAEEVFTGAFGASLSEASQAVGIVRQQLGAMPSSELQAVTEGAFAISDAFKQDLPRTIDAIKSLMSDFGMTSTQALDFLSKGFQDGLNRGEDFLQSVTEYAPQFANNGFAASEFFSVMQSGLQGGILGTDKAADAFKEFGVRIQDGSKLTRTALTQLGIEDVLTQLSNGTMTVADSFPTVISAIQSVNDPLLQAQIGVALFGTQWEDMGARAMLSLSTTQTSMQDMVGATDSLMTQYNDLGVIGTMVFREILVALSPLADLLLYFANAVLPQVLGAFAGLKSGLERIVNSIISAANSWGEGVGVNFANGILSSISYAVSAVQQLGDAIAYWLTPQSPPPILPDLDVWGRETAQVYVDAFNDADVGVLRELGSSIAASFQSISGATSNGVSTVIKTITQASTQASRLAQTFDRVERASDDLGQSQMTLAQAQQRLKDITASYDRVLSPLRKQLEGIRDAEEAINREQRIKELQDQISGTKSEAENALTPIKRQLRDIAKEQRKSELLADIEEYKKAASDTNPERAQAGALKLAQAQLELQALELEHQIELEQDKQAEVDRVTEAKKAQLELDRIATEQSISAIERQRDASLEAAQAIADAMQSAQGSGGGKGVDEAAKKAEEARKAQEAYNYSIADTEGKLGILRNKLASVEQGSAEYYQILGQVAGLEETQAKEQDALSEKAIAASKARIDAERNYNFQVANTTGKLGILRGELANVETGSVEYFSILGQIASLEAQAAREAEALAKGVGGAGSAAGGAGIGLASMKDMLSQMPTPINTVEEALSGVTSQYTANLEGIKELKLEMGGLASTATETIVPLQTFGSFMLSNIVPAVLGAATAIMLSFVPAMFTAAAAAWSAVAAFAAAAAPIVALAAVGALIGVAWSTNFLGIQDITFSVLGAIQGVITNVIGFITGFWQSNGDSIKGNAQNVWNTVLSTITSVLDNVRGVISTFVGFITSFWQANGATILTNATDIWTKVYNIIKTSVQLIGAIITNVFTVGSTIISTMLGIIQTIVVKVWGFIVGFITTNSDTIKLVVDTLWNGIKNTIDLVLGVIQGIVTAALGIITGDWDKAKEGISTIVESLVTFVRAQFDNLKTFVTTIGPEMLEAAKSIGTAIIDGIANGISNGAQTIVSAAKGAAKSALDAAKGFLGINSPSKVFEMQVGANIIEGMALGLRDIDPIQRAMSDLVSSIVPSTSGASQTNTNWNVTINTTQPTSNVLSGLALRQQLIGG